MAFFSVIIPLYNKENYIEKALNSILNQTFTDYEVWIIDDGSTDKSVEKVVPFLSEKIKLIQHQKNSGLSASRNSGIQHSNCNYITFLDADDVWKPHFLSTIHSLINQFAEARIYATNYEELYAHKVVRPINGSEILKDDFKGLVDFFRINVKQGFYNHGSVCFHKSVFEKAGLYDETIDFAEDIDFNIRANYHFKLAYANTVGMSYLMQSENQLTTTSILHKRVPDFDQYTNWEENNPILKKYIDFERYVLSKHLKVDGNSELSKKISASIDTNNLNWKQNMLLKMPSFLLIMITKIKLYLVRKGMKFSSY